MNNKNEKLKNKTIIPKINNNRNNFEIDNYKDETKKEENFDEEIKPSKDKKIFVLKENNSSSRSTRNIFNNKAEDEFEK